MEYTTNKNLKMPELTEASSIVDINDNTFIIDAALQENEDNIDTVNTLVIDNTNTLQGLIDDIEELLDTVYMKLTGKTGGQILQGGLASGENLTLMSTAHATKGNIIIGTSKYDEVNNRLGIGKTPTESIDTDGNIQGEDIKSLSGSKLGCGGTYNIISMTKNITVLENEVLTFNVPIGQVFDTDDYTLTINSGGFVIINQER